MNKDILITETLMTWAKLSTETWDKLSTDPLRLFLSMSKDHFRPVSIS